LRKIISDNDELFVWAVSKEKRKTTPVEKLWHIRGNEIDDDNDGKYVKTGKAKSYMNVYVLENCVGKAMASRGVPTIAHSSQVPLMSSKTLAVPCKYISIVGKVLSFPPYRAFLFSSSSRTDFHFSVLYRLLMNSLSGWGPEPDQGIGRPKELRGAVYYNDNIGLRNIA